MTLRKCLKLVWIFTFVSFVTFFFFLKDAGVLFYSPERSFWSLGSGCLMITPVVGSFVDCFRTIHRVWSTCVYSFYTLSKPEFFFYLYFNLLYSDLVLQYWRWFRRSWRDSGRSDEGHPDNTLVGFHLFIWSLTWTYMFSSLSETQTHTHAYVFLFYIFVHLYKRLVLQQGQPKIHSKRGNK